MSRNQDGLFGQPHADPPQEAAGRGVIHQLKMFFALSRTPHGLLDLATPALAALLWLGHFPSWRVMGLGLIAAFAGYTAVYALNDLVDYRVDSEKMKDYPPSQTDGYLDAVLPRHPMAQGLLSYRKGLYWVVGWALIAMIAAYQLNPICTLILLLGVVLEAIYCLTIRVTHLRSLVSGVVKTLGGVAAVYAVDPEPSPAFVLILFIWLFFWEIGGQKVPADWHDIEEDRRLEAKTVPVKYGPQGAGLIVLVSLVLTAVFNVVLFEVAPARIPAPYLVIGLIMTVFLLLQPAFRLYRYADHEQVSVLFTRASLYPLGILILVSLSLAI